MEVYEFETFIKDNNLDITKDFSLPIQKQVAIFNKLREKKEDTIEEDRIKVDKTLQERALKILSDMEEELQDQLINNEIVETEKPKVSKSKPIPEQKVSKPIALSDDEQIIQRIFYQGIYKVSRSELLKRGFKTKLEGKKIRVGKYLLVKFRFSYHYSIVLSKK